MDKRDRWTPMIEASHPMQTGAHDAYATAMEMVGNRHSKGALVDLVCWLVQRVDMAEDQLRARRAAGVLVDQPNGWEKCIEPGSWHCGTGVMGMTKDYAYRRFDSGWHRLKLPPAPGVTGTEPNRKEGS